METWHIQNCSLPGLATLINEYDAFLVDLWGVIYGGDAPYPRALEAINQLLRHDKSVIFLSNAPRPGHLVLKKLLDSGIQNHPLLSILTSADLVREELEAITAQGKKIYHVDPERNDDILQDLGIIEATRLEEADLLLLTAYSEEEEGAHYYDDILNKACQKGIPILCANPDKIVFYENKTRYCSGTFAERYEKAGGKVHYYGKPHTAIYTKACERLAAHGLTDKSRFLMIGDTPETDLLGALNGGVHGLLVLTGNMERRNLTDLAAPYPHWILPALQW